MISLLYFLRLAALNLLRGGQRVLVAWLCIAFGVASLVSLTMIARSIEGALHVPPAQLVGGDLSMGRAHEAYIGPEHAAQLETLRRSGEISAYTLIAFNSSSLMFRTLESGKLHFAGTGMGIQPHTYPLTGSLTVAEPPGLSLSSLLQAPGDVLLTRDVAEQYGIRVGDRLQLTDLRVGVPLEAVVRGIVSDTPNHRGDKFYYSLATAERLSNGGPAINTAIANSPRSGEILSDLEQAGWSVDWVTGRLSGKEGNAWVMGLRGAGVLGLLVGGIGIANTMQALLRRRQREIAIWKTLGYREADLRLIFSFEAGLLGLTGSLFGAGLGILFSSRVLELFRRTSSTLFELTFSPTPPLLGILIGTLTAVIFASWAIAITGQARPMALLRNEPPEVNGPSGCASVGLGLFLAAPFTVLAVLVMGSALEGIGVVLLTGAGIGALAVFFSLARTVLLWVAVRLVPLHRFPLLRMAFSGLQRDGFSLVFAVIALFIGALAISVSMAVAQFSGSRIAAGSGDFQGFNLAILGGTDQESAILRAVQEQQAEQVGLGYRAALAGLQSAGDEQIEPVMVGRSDPQDYRLDGAEWGSRPGGVYVPQWAGLPPGSSVQVTTLDGARKSLPVIGSYTVNEESLVLDPSQGLLLSAEDFTQIAAPDSLTVFARFAPDRLEPAAEALGAALPRAAVLDLVAYAGRYMEQYRKLYFLPLAIAGLALLAGLLLVANSVSLAMLERRYEIGILKTVGYSRRQVLSIFSAQYGLAGLLATAAGVLCVQGALALLALANRANPAAILLNLPSLLVIAFFGVGLPLVTVLWVAWNPARVPPLVVLNDR